MGFSRPTQRSVRLAILGLAVVLAGLGALFPELPGASALASAAAALKAFVGAP